MAETERVMKQLLLRGNTLAESVASLLALVEADVPESHGAPVRDYRDRLRAWSADVRAVASEEKP
jgi:hypothetical protein